jgi:putative ABC transport system permease protein
MAAEGLAEADYPSVTGYQVDSDIVKTLGLDLIAGAGFSSTWKEEQGYAYVINERALRALGWQPDQAVGRWMSLNGRRGSVVGVVKDFHFASLREEIGPLAMFIERGEFKHLLVKIGASGLQGALDFMRTQWHEFAPNSPLEFSFLDREFEALYRSEQRTGQLLNVFAVLAIFVACLGLLGLASFTAEQRTKEIGVRKVLGASAANIVGLLSEDFLKLVLLAFVLALPIAWLAMNQWLQNFAYRVEISPWVFVLSGGLALVIALLTVSTQAIKAALTNPVDSLRYE